MIRSLVTVFVVSACLAVPGHGQCQENRPWDGFSPYVQHVYSVMLPDTSVAMADADAQQFVARRGTRGATYLAVGLLCRNREADAANAAAILRDVLRHQYNAPDERRHGVWRTSPKATKLDENWREFVGVGLIVATEEFADRMDKSLRKEIDASLRRAAEGAARRDVSPGYTNIALMSAFLLSHVGTAQNQPAWVEQGRKKAKAIAALFDEHKTFEEFNSPTYYGTDLLGLALWRKYGPDGTLHELGARLEAELWREIAAFYHAGLKNMVGPYFRSYGMDMTQYTALTGECIALALNDGQRAPVPEVGTGRHSFEWNYAPLFTVLGEAVPSNALKSLVEFTGARRLQRTVVTRRHEHQIQAVVEERWMIGSATNLLRRWDQRCPGTIHWQANDQHQVGWLLVCGENAASCTIERNTLQVRLPLKDRADHPLRIQLNAPGVTPEMVTSAEWKLPGITLKVATPLGTPVVKWTNAARLGRVIEAQWKVPAGLADDVCALAIEPQP